MGAMVTSTGNTTGKLRIVGVLHGETRATLSWSAPIRRARASVASSWVATVTPLCTQKQKPEMVRYLSKRRALQPRSRSFDVWCHFSLWATPFSLCIIFTSFSLEADLWMCDATSLIGQHRLFFAYYSLRCG